MASLGGLDYFGPSSLREAELKRAERAMRDRSNGTDEMSSPAVSCNRMEHSGSVGDSRMLSSHQSHRNIGTSSSVSNRAAAERLLETGDGVVIEERRRRADGDGYTTHRYIRGRMLGKGGFAKVYLCTSMDTGKNYAVKIVPKANLVKARARQKVRKIDDCKMAHVLQTQLFSHIMSLALFFSCKPRSKFTVPSSIETCASTSTSSRIETTAISCSSFVTIRA